MGVRGHALLLGRRLDLLDLHRDVFECVRARDAARDYLSFDRDAQRIQPHQYLAVCRAEAAGVVRVNVEWDDTPAVIAATRALVNKGLRREKAAEVVAAEEAKAEEAEVRAAEARVSAKGATALSLIHI